MTASLKALCDKPFELLREELGELATASPGLPFSGGADGYFGYDLGRITWQRRQA